MVFGVRGRHEGETAELAIEERVRNVAAFPLAVPLLAGPGAITATVLLAGQAGGHPLRLAILIAVVVLIAGSCLVTFLFAERISGLLGMTGNIVLSRLLGCFWRRSPCNTSSTVSAPPSAAERSLTRKAA